MNNNIFNYVSINDDNEKEFNNDWIVWYHKDYNDVQRAIKLYEKNNFVINCNYNDEKVLYMKKIL